MSRASKKNDPETATTFFPLPERVGIETIEELTTELAQRDFTAMPSLVLDVAATQSITTPGIQLIFSLEKTIAACGGALSIKNSSAAFAAAFQDSGFQDFLNRVTEGAATKQ